MEFKSALFIERGKGKAVFIPKSIQVDSSPHSGKITTKKSKQNHLHVCAQMATVAHYAA